MSIKETGIIKKKRCLSKTEHSDVEKNIITDAIYETLVTPKIFIHNETGIATK